MARRCMLPLFLFAACATAEGARPVPVDVRGDGDTELLRGFSLRAAKAGDAGTTCQRHSDDVDITVVLPADTRLQRLVVESEEGVDVLTLIVDAAAGAGTMACTLQVARRDHQLALVLRNLATATETTLAVFQS